MNKEYNKIQIAKSDIFLIIFVFTIFIIIITNIFISLLLKKEAFIKEQDLEITKLRDNCKYLEEQNQYYKKNHSVYNSIIDKKY